MVNWKEILKNKLTEKQFSLVPTSFDVVGDILIFSDFPEELKKKEKLIGDIILKHMVNIKVVCKKTKIHSGVYRTKKVKIMAGARRKKTLHRENNAQFKLNVETCYFSPRLSHERKRIFQLVKEGESVLVMFSGVGVYPIIISRNTKAKEVYGVEINPDAHRFAEENVKLNKTKNVKVFLGDVNDVVPKLKKKFDRILMPLPKSAEEFLGLAVKYAKKGATIHFYDFLYEQDFDESVKKIRKHCKNCKILRLVKCGQYAPRKLRICVDFKVSL